MNHKHRAFVTAYLGEAQGNATKAAIIAGYSERRARQTGSDLVAHRDIRAAIEQKLEKHEITSTKVLERLGRIVTTEVEDIKASDVIAAGKVILQVNGALQPKQSTQGITVNIGFLQPAPSEPPRISITSEAITTDAVVMAHGALVPVPGAK